MLPNSKLIPAVALSAALVGGSVGALLRSGKTTQPAETTATTTTTAPTQTSADGTKTSAETTDKSLVNGGETSNLSSEQAAYRDGFDEGFRIARDSNASQPTTRLASSSGRSATRTRVVYRNTSGARSSRVNTSRQAYYDYSERPRTRSFWQKHRDKLTVAMGAGGGAIIGGLIGGKKGAAIGALAGGGGSALYTYKLRNRSRRY
jgi:hypothetical protein